ncbi:LuxR family transcriptional regulator [Pelagovum pacificum]|uniref:LuxR family transcriptional regulator n=2 Tax=Pelagovum pacificum TaxID=2588711 RepID=A0A5C5GKK3_9RHOB|nr:autoinducer binding domain-containing protein [Pelagovum pacificum]TNY34321.1 LuxR family transcriptional regulator [Pelagovum pacificum]
MTEVNNLPPDWVDHYTRQRYMLQDPVMRWIYANTGAIRWSAIDLDDPYRILAQARTFGLAYGLAVSVFDGNSEGQRSFGTFVRSDREFDDGEISMLSSYVSRRHDQKAPPTNLTAAELEALRMVKEGMRAKQIAFRLGVTEGAVKQRLTNAKKKLGASTGTQAATMATEFGLI